MDQKELKKYENQCVQEEAPFCRAACPLHVDVRTFMSQVRSGRWQDARKTLTATMPFSGIVGRICDHPCQHACKRGEVDDAIAIAELERTCVMTTEPVREVRKPPAKSVPLAVIGGGLSSLTAAWDLSRKGYEVTLFRGDERLGGAVRQLDERILPQRVIKEEIDVFTEVIKGRVLQEKNK